MKNVLFGIDAGNKAAQALGWALWRASYIQGHPGEVSTRGELSSGASFDKKLGVWKLHNTAWWWYGGAKFPVGIAADRLARIAPEVGFGQPAETEDERGDKSTPFSEAIWRVASASHMAWVERRKAA